MIFIIKIKNKVCQCVSPISVRDGQSVAPALNRVNEGCRNQEQIQVVYEI